MSDFICVVLLLLLLQSHRLYKIASSATDAAVTCTRAQTPTHSLTHAHTHTLDLPPISRGPALALTHSHSLARTSYTPIHARYNFNAFLNGPRNCLGSHLALLEARIVLSLLNQRFTFTPVDEKSGEVDEFTVPTCPKNGMWVYVN